MDKFLHELSDFSQLIAVVSDEKRIDPILVEKDYWIMHCLWGLQNLGLIFELKGGTSLSKGFGIIHRFSEDIDLRIDPPIEMDVKVGRNQSKPAQVESRRRFYEQLAIDIKIPGIVNVQRDSAFDDIKQLRSAGIRLSYDTKQFALEGVKDGILLEVGFDDTTPNRPVTISSWAWETATIKRVKVKDNRAHNVLCYAPTHTFVEKLQTISTKYRALDKSEKFPTNFLRHYYDVYCLLELNEIQEFIKQTSYIERKQQRFRLGDEQVIAKNPAFTLNNTDERLRFAKEFKKTASLYYQGQPTFEVILARIHQYIDRM